MTRIVLNQCYGGFSLSEACKRKIAELRQVPFDPEAEWHDIDRTDPHLLQAIDELGASVCSGTVAKLIISEMPSGAKYRILEYDGWEWIETPEQIEWKTA